ncbi:MAG TPA: SCO family protein [Thermodesulfovibrionales bacterium]|nr:SCO family protein [Thermodesulfovibrionales bacterium]
MGRSSDFLHFSNFFAKLFMRRNAFALLFLLASFIGTVSAEANTSETTIGIEERLGEKMPADATFHDEEGNVITFREVIGRPTILSFVYLSCTHACPLLLGGIAEALATLKLSPEKDYSVVTISFDELDKPAVAREKKRDFIRAVGRPFPEGSWRFLTGDRENIKKVTDAAGFSFRRERDGFSHAVALIILSPDGKITRYLYGKTFSSFDLTLALTEASKGKVGLSTNRLFLFCYSYDSEQKRYVFNLLKVFGTVMLILLISFFAYLAVTGRKRRREER